MVNFIACLLYAYLFFEYQLYGETVLQTLFMGMAVYGFFPVENYTAAKTAHRHSKLAIL